MKKIISVILSAFLVFGGCAPCVLAANEETTEFVLEIDVNKRYTDFVEDTEGLTTDADEEEKENKKMIYIAVLVAALVVSVVILVVSLKRVPEEENVDISGKKKSRKKRNKEE